MIWNHYQFMALHQAANAPTSERQNVERVRANVVALEDKIAELRSGIDQLVLVNRALWEIVAEKHGLTEADLDAKVEEIDLRDGVRNGKVGVPERSCVACGRKARGERAKCLYCGEALTPG